MAKPWTTDPNYTLFFQAGQGGEAIHPSAPAFAGGAGAFVQAGSQGAFSNGLAGFPHPLSPANLQITPELVRKAAAAPATPFGVKDIPKVMTGKLNWPKSAALMQRWLDEPKLKMTKRQKEGDDLADTYPKTGLELKLFTMEWLLKYPRAGDALDVLKQRLDTPAALSQLKKLMASQPLVGKASFLIKNAADPVALHAHWQFQRSPLVESSMRAMDDLSGALGRFMFYAAVLAGEVTGSPSLLRVRKVGLYMRDTYDFLGGQYLGHWNEQGMGLPVAAAVASAAELEWSLPAYSVNHGWMTPINNSDFDAYRDKTGQGNDLLVFSDVLPFDTLIEVPL